MTDGVFHASGGSSWDAVAFEQTRIAKRNYEFKGSGLNDLHAG
jgi:hypothetical protein